MCEVEKIINMFRCFNSKYHRRVAYCCPKNVRKLKLMYKKLIQVPSGFNFYLAFEILIQDLRFEIGSLFITILQFETIQRRLF